MIGKDSVEIDNEGVILGYFKRTKEFLNIKKTRMLKDSKGTYEFKNKYGKVL